MIAFMIKTQARNNDQKRLIVKEKNSSNGRNRVELERIEQYDQDEGILNHSNKQQVV